MRYAQNGIAHIVSKVTSQFIMPKRGYTGSRVAKRQKYGTYTGTGSKAATKGRGVVPGYTRRSGYYGRFFGPGAKEKKFLDTELDDAGVTALMTSVNLCVVPQDDTESGRIGRKINITNIRIKIELTLLTGTAASTSSAGVWLLLIQDTQTNGAQYAGTDVLDTNTWLSYRNLANQERFKILFSKYVTFNSPGAGNTAAGTFDTLECKRVVKVNKRVSIPIEYDNSATTGAITTQRSNSIGWSTLADINNLILTDGVCRIRYIDN